jgi:LPS sulfotransferase NodH
MEASIPSTIRIRRPNRISVWFSNLRLLGQQRAHQLGLAGRWWLLPQTPHRPVFALATHRSGSNLLLDYAGQLTGVECLSEVLCTTLPYGISPKQSRPEFALRHIRRSLHALSAPLRACKLMLDQLTDCWLTLDSLNAAFPDAAYLILYRQSLAEQFLSRESAKATDQWFLVDGQQRKQSRVRIDPVRLRTYCDTIRNEYREIFDCAWLPERSVLLSYEELIANPEQCFAEQICPLLGVPPGPLTTNLRKQNTLPVEERVSNYREVAALLASPLCRQYYFWHERPHHKRRAA